MADAMTDPITSETWREMRYRHTAEAVGSVTRLADRGFTQTQAAWALQVELTMLNGFIRRHSIHWPIIAMGEKRPKVRPVEFKSSRAGYRAAFEALTAAVKARGSA